MNPEHRSRHSYGPRIERELKIPQQSWGHGIGSVALMAVCMFAFFVIATIVVGILIGRI